MTYYHVPPNNVVIELLGRTYTIKCTKEERESLQRAVVILEHEMEKVLQKHNNPSPEQVAIVSALNLAAQLDNQLPEVNTEAADHSQQKIDDMNAQCQALIQSLEKHDLS